MDLLRNLFGSLASGIIRLAVTAGILFLAYLFIVKPILDTTNEAIRSTGLDKIGRSLEGMSTQIKRQVHRSFEGTGSAARKQKLVHCVKRASGDVQRIERCARRF
jgi:hypothetical protein